MNLQSFIVIFYVKLENTNDYPEAWATTLYNTDAVSAVNAAQRRFKSFYKDALFEIIRIEVKPAKQFANDLI